MKLELENHFNYIPEITLAKFNKEMNRFNEVILKVLNNHAPLKLASRKQKRLSQKYFYAETTKNKSHPKKMWKTLKEMRLTNTKQPKFCDPPTKLYDSSNNTSLKNPTEIAESFKTYFVIIDTYLADQIPQTLRLQSKMNLKNRI